MPLVTAVAGAVVSQLPVGKNCAHVGNVMTSDSVPVPRTSAVLAGVNTIGTAGELEDPTGLAHAATSAPGLPPPAGTAMGMLLNDAGAGGVIAPVASTAAPPCSETVADVEPLGQLTMTDSVAVLLTSTRSMMML
jgi:hypothetical protein